MLEIPMDKRHRAALFRSRLKIAIDRAGSNQSDLARRSNVDRSTISQILRDDAARLPNAQVVGSCAEVLGVSADWLLGLAEHPETAAELMASALTLTDAPRALIDQQIFDWHQEANGYKIRHVPAALPDMLKTNDVLEWEYGPHLGRTASQAITASANRLAWMRQSGSDYEIAMPLYEIDSFVEGTGYYAGLPVSVRAQQMDHWLDLSSALYPRLRLYLFDARRLYSAPITVFGPLLAVIYVGRNYLAFRDTQRVRAFSDHFDHLVREARISARDVPNHLASLRRSLA
ncbi:helix-turn-helix domain-containing protein [Marivita sp. S6314]|uniref:helix-turn-helix domain-containing protein n=1 Tax=Marivita sp. S6314 TaxID=2926406 RepID=UPI001FF3B3E1|nr:helix-turn-helix transcriptional regulator [Marivita sp. S6314]MCK0150642.1 helix-turn-helix domain-containing protein [Marivita sp. S6314]